VVPIEHNVANATKYATNSMNEKKHATDAVMQNAKLEVRN